MARSPLRRADLGTKCTDARGLHSMACGDDRTGQRDDAGGTRENADNIEARTYACERTRVYASRTLKRRAVRKIEKAGQNPLTVRKCGDRIKTT